MSQVMDMNSELACYRLCSEKGWRVRLFSSIGSPGEGTVDALRAAWRPDDHTLVVLVDPTSPNMCGPSHMWSTCLIHRSQ